MQQSTRKTVTILGLAVLLVFGFSFALVPLYRVACKKIGLNTSVPLSEFKEGALEAALPGVEQGRDFQVQFMAIPNERLNWDFKPNTRQLSVHPGQKVRVTFYAKNNTTDDMTVQAIPSMTPVEAVKHFHKIQCFCFDKQSLKAGEAKKMVLVFQVDKDLPKEVHTITLAYTLFDVTAGKPRIAHGH